MYTKRTLAIRINQFIDYKIYKVVTLANIIPGMKYGHVAMLSIETMTKYRPCRLGPKNGHWPRKGAMVMH